MHNWQSRNIDAHEGTFGWIMEDSQTLLNDLPADQSAEVGADSDVKVARQKAEQARKLQNWLRSPSDRSVFWIHGKAGSGKLTLMKTISDHARTKKLAALSAGSGTEVITLAFFAFRAGSELESKLVGMWRGLLYQLTKQCRNLLADSSPLKDWAEGEVPVAPSGRLLTALKTMLTEVSKHRTLVILLDGLDEVTEGEHSDLVTYIQQLTISAKICVASRKDKIFSNTFGGLNHDLALHNLTAMDMSIVIRSRLEAAQAEGFPMYDADLRSLAQKTLSRAEGVFLWVNLVTKSLARGLTNGDDTPFLEDRLRTKPKEIDALLEQMLYGIDEVYRRPAAWILLWTSDRQRYLTLDSPQITAYTEAALASSPHPECSDLAEVSAFVRNPYYAIDSLLDDTPDGVGSFSVEQETLKLRAWTNDLVEYSSLGSVSGREKRRTILLHRTVLDFVDQHREELVEWLGTTFQHALYEVNRHLRVMPEVSMWRSLESFSDELRRFAQIMDRDDDTLQDWLTGPYSFARILMKLDDMANAISDGPANSHWTSFILDFDAYDHDLLPASKVSNVAVVTPDESDPDKGLTEDLRRYDIEGNGLPAFLTNRSLHNMFWTMVKSCTSEEVARSKQFWLECATVSVFQLSINNEGWLWHETETVLRIVDELGADLNQPILRIYGGSLSAWQRLVSQRRCRWVARLYRL